MTSPAKPGQLSAGSSTRLRSRPDIFPTWPNIRHSVSNSASMPRCAGPLAIGAVALALGTAVGLAVPQTAENEWMGEARDTLVDKAQSVSQDAIEKVQQVARR